MGLRDTIGFDWLTTSPPLLPKLGPHLPTLLISSASFFLVQILAHRWIERRWGHVDARSRRGMTSHSVSMLHALIIIPLALRSLSSDILAKDRVFGYDPMVGHVLALSTGYFIWDTINSFRFSTAGFVVHGACCLAVYLFTFRPFAAGFGPPFLLWEMSTPFLNIHWFMDKLALTKAYPTVFLLNALIFMLVFFLARILYGGYQSIALFQVMWQERDRIPLHLHVIFSVGNISLNALNWLWFSKMFRKMLARLSGDAVSTSSSEEVAREKGMGEKQALLDKKSPQDQGEVDLSEKARGQGEMDGMGEEETLSLPAKPPW